MIDFGNIIYRTDIKAYIIKNGTYMVPHPEDTTVPESLHAEFDALWHEIDDYAKAHPEMVTEEQPSPPSEPTLDELKAEKLFEINRSYDKVMSSLVSTYPATELLTFDKQEAEARAWQSDNSTSTPLIDALALGRGIDKAELVRRIIVKADAFALTTGYLTGQRQRYEDFIDAATTAEEVAAIVPEYTMPETENSTEDGLTSSPA